jgi:hypothetical protein
MSSTFAAPAIIIKILLAPKKKCTTLHYLQRITRGRHQRRVRLVPISQVGRASDDRTPQVGGIPIWRGVRQRQARKVNVMIDEGGGFEQRRGVKVKREH